MGNGEWAGGLVRVTICMYRDSSLALRMTGPAGEWGCEEMIKHFSQPLIIVMRFCL